MNCHESVPQSLTKKLFLYFLSIHPDKIGQRLQNKWEECIRENMYMTMGGRKRGKKRGEREKSKTRTPSLSITQPSSMLAKATFLRPQHKCLPILGRHQSTQGLLWRQTAQKSFQKREIKFPGEATKHPTRNRKS